MTLYSAISFLTPFLLGHPQLLVGVIVNAALVASARNLSWHRTLPIIILPSLGVLSRGLIFGPLTPYLVMMIPAIWLSNAIIVFAFKYLSQRMNHWVGMTISSCIKAAFLFITAWILVTATILPEPFLIAMGPIQLTTALAGGALALFGAGVVDSILKVTTK